MEAMVARDRTVPSVFRTAFDKLAVKIVMSRCSDLHRQGFSKTRKMKCEVSFDSSDVYLAS